MNTYKRCYNYENIKLVLFLQVAKTSNYNLLCFDGEPDEKECTIAWEEIIKSNGEATGGMELDIFNDLKESYGLLLQDYNVIKVIILKLHFVIDYDDINYLKSKGYKFEFKNNKEYITCLLNAKNRAGDIVTKMKMKRNEIDELTKKKEGNEISIADLITDLNFELKFAAVDADVLLSVYNAYSNKIKHNNARIRKERYN